MSVPGVFTVKPLVVNPTIWLGVRNPLFISLKVKPALFPVTVELAGLPDKSVTPASVTWNCGTANPSTDKSYRAPVGLEVAR